LTICDKLVQENFALNQNLCNFTQTYFLAMDLQTRKIHFIQEFLRTANSNILEKFEKMLRQERKKMYENDVKPMTIDEYEKRIDLAIDDYKNNRLSSTKKLKNDIASWK
jgi:hypothetical protein